MDKPVSSALPQGDHEWLVSVYGEVKEIIPKRLPVLKGKSVITSTYKDAKPVP